MFKCIVPSENKKRLKEKIYSWLYDLTLVFGGAFFVLKWCLLLKYSKTSINNLPTKGNWLSEKKNASLSAFLPLSSEGMVLQNNMPCNKNCRCGNHALRGANPNMNYCAIRFILRIEETDESRFILISYIPTDIFFVSGWGWMLPLVSGRWISIISCGKRVFSLQYRWGGGTWISDSGQSMIFTSCCLQHPCRVHRVQYARVCPRFPLPDSSPPGKEPRVAIGKKKKGRRETSKEVSVLPLLTEGAGISRMIFLPLLSSAPERLCDEPVTAEVASVSSRHLEITSPENRWMCVLSDDLLQMGSISNKSFFFLASPR